ncbi:MAG TPA: hypothetical protein VF618_27050 [Thermoanaerobaculia bacterium]
MPTRNGVLLLLALVVLASCGGGPTEPRDFEFGRADVFVRDPAGQPINGVPVRLERTGGQVEDAGGVTGSVGLPGYYFFLKTSGDFRIVITPPPGYELAAGQTASVPFTFTRNQLRTINFVLRAV